MLKQVDVNYVGWGEHWRWGTLVSSNTFTGRPTIVFEYSDEAQRRGLELSAYQLPLDGPKLRKDFPAHQLGLPGPIYDSLPDGWGMLLMDRLFKRRGLNPVRIGPLERLTYIGDHAMGALSFEPMAPEVSASNEDIGVQEAELLARNAADIIDKICYVASNFTSKAKSMFPSQITQDTLRTIQGRINDNIYRLSGSSLT